MSPAFRVVIFWYTQPKKFGELWAPGFFLCTCPKGSFALGHLPAQTSSATSLTTGLVVEYHSTQQGDQENMCFLCLLVGFADPSVLFPRPTGPCSHFG